MKKHVLRSERVLLNTVSFDLEFIKKFRRKGAAASPPLNASLPDHLFPWGTRIVPRSVMRL